MRWSVRTPTTGRGIASGRVRTRGHGNPLQGRCPHQGCCILIYHVPVDCYSTRRRTLSCVYLLLLHKFRTDAKHTTFFITDFIFCVIGYSSNKGTQDGVLRLLVFQNATALVRTPTTEWGLVGFFTDHYFRFLPS